MVAFVRAAARRRRASRVERLFDRTMHRILLREVVIDAPTETFDVMRNFWSAALAADARQVTEFPEFTGLVEPASRSWVGVQRIGEGPARYHLGIETDDVEAEVRRLLALGAGRVAEGRKRGS